VSQNAVKMLNNAAENVTCCRGKSWVSVLTVGLIHWHQKLKKNVKFDTK